MNWPSFDAFIGMGGYGLYVWSAYALTLALLAAETVLAARRHRRALHAAAGSTDAAGAADR